MTEKSIPIEKFDVNTIRKDFPILQREVNGHPLVYLDNAATSQTPQQVIDTIVEYYQGYNANIHRGVHTLSQEATDAFEKGIRSGDLISEVGQQPVTTAADVSSALKAAKEAGRKSVLLLVRREGNPRFVALSLEG